MGPMGQGEGWGGGAGVRLESVSEDVTVGVVADDREARGGGKGRKKRVGWREFGHDSTMAQIACLRIAGGGAGLGGGSAGRGGDCGAVGAVGWDGSIMG
jgi:hypothetical protein